MILSLKVLDLEAGSEVIVPSNTYIATILAILQNNLKPVFVEPDEFTFNISPSEVNKALTLKTKAILAVHLYGQLADMQSINEIAKENKLLVIEDAAQSDVPVVESDVTDVPKSDDAEGSN